MHITRRHSLKLAAAAAGSFALHRAWARESQLTIAPGPFTTSPASLKKYKISAWLGESKFGIWSHWGPQSAVGDGDWYARNMYIEGSERYAYHQQRFGPQSKVGYKDLIHPFTADRWDPDALIDLYVKAGAKYFFSMGVHHDNFDLWNSKHQRRWNSVVRGPGKDIVGLWNQAARKRGLRFGVSEHLSNSYDWFAPSHLSDKSGSYRGISYDGSDTAYADLYHDYKDEPSTFAAEAQPMRRIAPTAWKQTYYLRIMDLLEQHTPDMLYTDGGITFEEYDRAPIAELYNLNVKANNGAVEAVYFSKIVADCAVGTCALDRERGVLDDIWPEPWQTDTCIGYWHYKRGIQCKSAKKVIDLLVDIVSKNGNLLLNFPLPASGELDPEECNVLEGITEWMSVNSEGIYETTPRKIYGEGPAMQVHAGEGMNETTRPDLTALDFRFTAKGKILYVFVQGWREGESIIRALGSDSPQRPGRVASVEMLGMHLPVRFKQNAPALLVLFPERRPAAAATGITLKVRFA